MNQGFKASLFHPDYGNEAVAGRILIGRLSLQFHSPVVNEEIPVDRIEVDAAREDGRIVFSDPDRPELQIFTSDRSMLKHPTFLQCNPLRNQVRSKRERINTARALRLTGYFAGACLVLYIVGSLAMSLAVRALVDRVPLEWEQKFGQMEIDVLRENQELVTDQEKVAQLTALAEPLISVIPDLKSKPTFYIAKSEDPNAFALPGGYVVVNTALIEMADRPEELLGVLAHEMAHVSQKHVERNLIAAAGPFVIFGMFMQSNNELVGLLGQGSAIMVIQGFSQEYETEADDKGWEFLVAAKIDPQGMITTFRKFQEFEAAEKSNDDGIPVPEAFQSHPALRKRIARLESKLKKLRDKTSFVTLNAEAWRALKSTNAPAKN